MITGIYCIENIINFKKYIGRAINIYGRKRSHFFALKNNIHHGNHFQRAWNKYGENAFIFYIIEICSIEDLNDREKFWISHFKTFGYNGDFGYNETSGGDSNYIVSQETKEKLRNAHLGHTLSLQHRENISKGNMGNHMSNETKTKISASHKKIYENNPDKNNGSNNSFYGKSHTKESKSKISYSRKGISIGEEHPNNKLKESDVLKILDLKYNKKMRNIEIIHMYSNTCSASCVESIIYGRCWKHIYSEFTKEGG